MSHLCSHKYYGLAVAAAMAGLFFIVVRRGVRTERKCFLCEKATNKGIKRWKKVGKRGEKEEKRPFCENNLLFCCTEYIKGIYLHRKHKEAYMKKLG